MIAHPIAVNPVHQATRPPRRSSRPFCALVTACAVLLFASCRKPNAYVPPPPPKVVVGTAQKRAVTLYREFTGTTQASKSVDLRSRVAGYLADIGFDDGDTVPADKTLFVIDRRPFVAQLDQATAQLKAKQATATQLESIFRRDDSLLPSQAVTQEQVDIDRGNWLTAAAAVDQAQASVREANLNLGYTEIKSPFPGRIGRRMIDEGNLVTADRTLATIYRYDPMYVYFNVSDTDYSEYLRRQRQATDSARPVELALPEETEYKHKGTIDFAEPTVDPSTGTLTLRGVFVNPPPYKLVPGLFVRVRVPLATLPAALLVPDRAIGTDQAGRFLLIVDEKNKVQRRAVKIGQAEQDLRVIEEGISLDERFVVEGLQRARPGNEVVPTTAEEAAKE